LVSELLSLKNDKLLDEGSVYFVRSPTVGTGIAGSILVAYTDVSPLIIVTNNNPIGGRNIFLDTIRLTLTVAPASATNLQWATSIDNIARYSSGGAGGAGTGAAANLLGPYSPNTGIGASSGALVYAGALVAVARSNQFRQLENGFLRSAIPVVNDQYLFSFGGHEQMYDGVLVSGVAIAQRTIPHGMVEIGPGHSFLLHHWALANAVTGPSFEVQIAYHER
jgi:hypothetical protein